MDGRAALRSMPAMTRAGDEPRSTFELSKWYLDCVGEGGDVFIAYAAEVRWRALSLRYTSTLVQRAGHATHIEATLRSAPPPVIDGGVLTWAAPALDVSGRWEARAPEVRDTVLEADDGRVEWRCWMPKARAEIALASGPIRGLGYAEHLTLTVPPWQMPIDELWWGRFLSEDASLVWIDWRGPHTRHVVFLDGEARGPAHIDERGLATADGAVRLALTEPRVLREGALGKTALAILPAVDAVLPVRILATEERKWVARGTLDRDGHHSEGWVIHEVVRWPC
ncbi:Hypothetical protein A7982_04627 [Minicystis rosea]|nr:Hypothetical protein A7982_04627 [Minicystis rosea]